MSQHSVSVAHVTTIDMGLRYLLLNQLRSIQQAGYRVTGISSPGPDVPAVVGAGIRHVPVPMTRNLTPLADLVSLWRLVRVMRRERFTIVHTHNPKPGLLGQLAARLAGVPVVINTLHGFYFHEHMHPAWRRFYVTMEKVAARCSDVILSQNKEDIQTAIREDICSPEMIKYLGNGIDLNRYNPERFSKKDLERARQTLEIPLDAFVIGFVGRLAAKRKGFLDFLAAGRLVAERLPGVRFLVVGGTDHGKPDAVEPLVASQYGIQDFCLFLGHQPNQKLPWYYLSMNVLVLPSQLEGLPRVVMEASAMEVPVVATNVRGTREAVEHGRNGLLVPFGDHRALAAAIVEILTDRDKAQRMGREGRRLALERFDERLVFEKVKAEYARLLRAKGLSSPSLASDGTV